MTNLAELKKKLFEFVANLIRFRFLSKISVIDRTLASVPMNMLINNFVFPNPIEFGRNEAYFKTIFAIVLLKYVNTIESG